MMGECGIELAHTRILRWVQRYFPVFQKAIDGNGTPRVITLDACAASHRAVRTLKAEGTMPKRVRVRSGKYLKNGIEQDHRRVKQRVRIMLGFERFRTAAITISGIELAAKIRKHQFKVG